MGSPLSSILTNCVIQDLEYNIFKILAFSIPFYYRYVDDIVLAAKKNQIKTILGIFNSYHERIQFTVEYSE